MSCSTLKGLSIDINLIDKEPSKNKHADEQQITPCYISPITPTVPDFPQIPIEKQHSRYSLNESLIEHGYIKTNKIGDTLQGTVYFGRKVSNLNKKIIIKTTLKKLHYEGITILSSNKRIHVKENIIKEARIMKYLNKSKPKSKSGFIKLIDFIDDGINFIMIQEYGGQSLFKYVEYHVNKIDHKTWGIHVQKLFKQMVLYVNWLHNMNVCHLDISLENCVINTKDMIVNFIDYGVSEKFKNSNTQCNKFKVGKLPYQCGEVYNYNNQYEYFIAKKADIWSLGICLWMMLCGCPLYEKASKLDKYYENIMNGYLNHMITQWELNDNISTNAYDLLNKIFRPENKRITIKEILKHKYITSIPLY